MATELGVGYVSILPSMRGFAPALNAGLQAPMMMAGQKSGSSFGSGLIGGVTKVVKGASIGATIFGGIALKTGLDRLTTIQNATQSLTTIMGDAGKAAALMGQIKKTVQGTPFNLDQFADAGKNLVAMNIAGSKVPGILTAIGDAAATSGKGAEGVGQLVDTFGKMAAQGQVSLDQIWSISATGVPALQILANGFHTTTGDMKDLITKGAVPATKAIDILTQGIEHGSKGAAGSTIAFGGAMTGLRQTFTGAFGGMKAAVARFGAAALQPFLGLMTQSATGAGEFLDRVSKKFAPVMQSAANDVASLVSGLTGAKFAGVGKPLEAWVAKGEAVRRILGRIKDGAVGLYAFIAKGDFTGAFSRAFGVEEDSPVVDYMYKVRDAVGQVVQAFRSVDLSSVSTALNGTGAAFSQIGGVFTTVKNNAAVLKPAIQDIGTAMAGAAAGGGQILANLLHIAAGGIQFFADHTGIATAAILALTASMAASGPISEAYRLAYIIRTPLMIAQTVQAYVQAGATTALTAAINANTLANNGNVAASKQRIGVMIASRTWSLITAAATSVWSAATTLATGVGIAWLTVQQYGVVTATRMGVALVAQKIAMAASATWTGIVTAAQWAWNAALEANPIMWIVTAIAALIAGIVLFFTKTETGRKIWAAVWGGIKKVVAGVVDWFKGHVLPALQSVWSGIVAGAKWLWGVLKPVFGFIADHWRIVISFMLGPIGILIAYWHQLAAAAQWLWRSVLKPVFGAIATAWSVLWTGIKAAWNFAAPIFATIGKIIYAVLGGFVLGTFWVLKQAWNILWTGISWAWNNLGRVIFEAVAQVVGWLWNNAVQPIFELIKLEWQLVWAAVSWAWNNVGRPVIDAVGAAAGWLWNNVIQPAWAGIELGWQLLWDAISWAWTNVGQPLFSALGAAISWVWTNVIQPAWTAMKLSFSLLWSGLKSLWTSTGKPVFDGIGTAISWVWTKVIKPTFDAISSAWSTLWGGLKSGFDAVWGGVKTAIVTGINAVIGILNGLINGLNAVLGKLPGNFKIGNIPTIGGDTPKGGQAAKGSGSANDHSAKGFAVGGWVSGPGTGTSDSVPAMLSAGEHVTRENRAKKYPGLLTAINDGTYNGPDLPRYYADGGFVAPMMNAVRSKFPQAILNSGYRPGANDYHGRGQAVDLGWGPTPVGGNGNPGLAMMNAWLFDTYGKSTAELIYDGLGDNRPDLKNGAAHTYDAATSAQHHNHVHWALNSLAALGAAGQGAGKSGGGILSFISDVYSDFAGAALDTLESPVKALVGKLPDGIIKNFASGAVGKFDQIVRSIIGASGSSSGGGSTSGGGLDQWIAQAMGITHVPGSWAAGLHTLIMRESGGNPRAINNWDVNAKNGDPSRGLMQTIGSTFERYRSPSLVDDIYDPVANIVAGINYIKARYGDIAKVQQANANLAPKGYDQGGLLAPGATLTMNRTGVPEAVLNPLQWQSMHAIATAAGQSQDDAILQRLTSLELAVRESGADIADRNDAAVERQTSRMKARAGNVPLRGTR